MSLLRSEDHRLYVRQSISQLEPGRYRSRFCIFDPYAGTPAQHRPVYAPGYFLPRCRPDLATGLGVGFESSARGSRAADPAGSSMVM